MKSAVFIFILLFLIYSENLLPQSFSLNLYKQFLSEHSNMSPEELLSIYDAGKFKSAINQDISKAKYLDSVKIKFELTDDELLLLNKHGFVVTERVSSKDFIFMYLDIYHKDLPVLITTDAILNAFHKSYDVILKETEVEFLILKLKELLEKMHYSISDLKNQYKDYPQLDVMLKDVDLYIAMARKLLGENYQLQFPDNMSDIEILLGYIDKLAVAPYPLFSSKERKIDFSQFKVRGHYTDEIYPQLAKYFQSMMWLGRIELYLIAPKSDDLKQSIIDIQRQIIDSYLVSELINISGSNQLYEKIENTIKIFVGEQDNVELTQLRELFNELNIDSAADLLDTLTIKNFQEHLLKKPYSDQKILSQILMSDPYNPDTIKPASAFLLFGQRFVIDSYITNNVTYDRININGNKILRMLPSLLDVMFALGNSAAAQLLKDELERYNYSSNLASLRYLIDSYSDNFWKNSIYNLWLNSIKALNPKTDRSNYPEFMQTAAWWQQKLNTQISSWSELRHDNLLYAKQSYSPGWVCSYPYGYVEPIPEFYSTMKLLATETLNKLISLSLTDSLQNYFNHFVSVMDTLYTLAEKELNNIPFTVSEINFLKHVVYDTPGCAPAFSGWYYDLIYRSQYGDYLNNTDFIVADYHTSPNDEMGYPVGWVKHAGTGKRNLMILIAEHPNEGWVTFSGPVNSYYEITTEGFLRISDEEWQKDYLNTASRPDWTNIYLADVDGKLRPQGINLITSVKENNKIAAEIPANIFIQNFPNPFNSSTVINFTIPAQLTRAQVELNIYNINGELVKQLFKGELQSGSYFVLWNGTSETNSNVSSGIYLYEIKANELRKIGKMTLLK